MLKIFGGKIDVDDLIDHNSCGDDVEKGKPDPALVRLAVEKLALPAGRCVMTTGDTPYDCKASANAGVAAFRLLSGGFARGALLEAGAIDVRGRISELILLAGNETAEKRSPASSPAADRAGSLEDGPGHGSPRT